MISYPAFGLNRLLLQFARQTRPLQLRVCLLVALFQRTPVVRLLSTFESAWVGPSTGQISMATVVAAALLGSVDTLVGATPVSPAPESSASAQVGVPYAATFAATGVPQSASSYAVRGLPPGLSIAGATFSPGTDTYSFNGPFGSISGVPATAGTYSVTITAWEFSNNSGPSGTYTYAVAVSPPSAIAPAFVVQPASQTAIAGNSATYAAAASGTPTPTYQWRKNGVDIAGANGETYTIPAVTGSDVGDYSVVAANSSGSVTSDAAALSVIFPPSNAVITLVVE